MGSGSLLGAAGDGGARETIAALSDGERCAMATPDAAQANDPHYWDTLLGDARCAGLVAGTSDSPAGRAIEALARRAAARHGKPVFAIEDYPGNYWPLADAPTAALAVESELVAAWQRERLGAQCPPLVVWPAPRYDAHRARRDELRAAILALPARAAPLVLWAGQPETDDNLASLAAVLPALRELGATLVLKAHPRDAGYPDRYRALLHDSGVAVEDATALGIEAALRRGVTLVMTQFSSVAIEAGFHGIPALHVLLPEAGAARLMQKKGYSVPFSVRADAAACLTKPTDATRVLRELLYDNGRRAHIMSRFDRYFCAHPGTARGLTDQWLLQARARPGAAGGPV